MLNCDPQGKGQILPCGYNMKSIHRGPLDETLCKFGNPRPYGFRQKDI